MILAVLIVIVTSTTSSVSLADGADQLPQESLEAIAFLEALKTVGDPYDLPQLPSEDGWYEYLLDFSTMFDEERDLDLLLIAEEKNSIPALITLLDFLLNQYVHEFESAGEEDELNAVFMKTDVLAEQLAKLSTDYGLIFTAWNRALQNDCEAIEYNSVLASAEHLQDPTFSTIAFVIAHVCDGELNFTFPETVYSFAPFRPAYFVAMATSMGETVNLYHQNQETRTLRVIGEFAYNYKIGNFPLEGFEADPMMFRRIERKLHIRYAGLYQVCESIATERRVPCYGLAFDGHRSCAPLGRRGDSLQVFPSKYYTDCRIRVLDYMESEYGKPKIR